MGEVNVCVLMMLPDNKAVGLNCKATPPPKKAAGVIPALHADGGRRDTLWPLRHAVRLTCSASERAPTVIGHHIGDREVLHSSTAPPPHAAFFPRPVRPSLSNLPPFPPPSPSLRNILPSPPSLLLFLIKVGPRQRRSLPLIYFHLKLVQLH